MKQYDAIIIGFGKAGKTLAAELSNRGWQVAIVERSNMMYGGSCPNVACIPTKTLVHEAEVSALLYHDDFPKQANMYKQAIGRKNRLTSFLRNDNYERLSKRPNVTIYTGTGSFISADTIKVELPEGEIELKGKEIDGIIQILLDKGFFDKESYEKFQILTSLEIQHIWIDATCRRKRKLEDLPYLLVNDTQKQEKENSLCYNRNDSYFLKGGFV